MECCSFEELSDDELYERLLDINAGLRYPYGTEDSDLFVNIVWLTKESPA